MINPNLHRQPVPLDPAQHGAMKVAFPVADWSVASRLNAIFVTANEFSEACKEYPVVFVRAGREAEGKETVAPIAVLGVVADQNLYLTGAAGSGQPRDWRAYYKPAVLQAYPFCIGRLDEQRFAVCLDAAWPGSNSPEGQSLFDAAGQPSEFLKAMRQHLEQFEGSVQATQAFCARLLELDLLRDMRFDATMPDGRKHTVDGFLTVDQEKTLALPDAVVGEMHRNGMLGLIQLHWASLGLMRRLVDWHLAGQPAGASAPAAAAGAPAASARPAASG